MNFFYSMQYIMESSVTLQQELKSLRTHLSQSQEKAKSWMGEEWDQMFSNATIKHQTELQAAAGRG